MGYSLIDVNSIREPTYGVLLEGINAIFETVDNIEDYYITLRIYCKNKILFRIVNPVFGNEAEDIAQCLMEYFFDACLPYDAGNFNADIIEHIFDVAVDYDVNEECDVNEEYDVISIEIILDLQSINSIGFPSEKYLLYKR